MNTRHWYACRHAQHKSSARSHFSAHFGINVEHVSYLLGSWRLSVFVHIRREQRMRLRLLWCTLAESALASMAIVGLNLFLQRHHRLGTKPRERSSSRRPQVRSADRWRSGFRAGERRRRRSVPGERKHRSSRGRSKCRKRKPGRSTASPAAERDRASLVFRRQEIPSRRLHQEKCERDRYQAQIFRNVEAAVKAMERRCASQIAKAWATRRC